LLEKKDDMPPVEKRNYKGNRTSSAGGEMARRNQGENPLLNKLSVKAGNKKQEWD